jgi:hypothetical protein
MKKLIAFLSIFFLTVAVMYLGPATVTAQKTYAKYYGIGLPASANRKIAPTYNGEHFRPEFCFFETFPNAGTSQKTATMVIYLPLDTGPDTAVDSFVVPVIAHIYTPGWVEYYGPISDTVRVTTESANVATLHFYQ